MCWGGKYLSRGGLCVGWSLYRNDRCKNITFPQLRLLPVMKIFVLIKAVV